MATYSTPGVYVNESPLTSLVQNTAGVSAAVFFGEAERGPTEPTLISDWTSYRVLFGELKNEFDLGYAVFHYFANGGRACYVVRVVDASATTASRNDVAFYPTGTGNASASFFDVEAISAGTWGNGLAVTTINGSQAPSSSSLGTFTFVVTLNGVEVERWVDLSIDPDRSRYVASVVNNFSRFVRISDVATNVAPDTDLTWASGPTTLTSGSQGSVVDNDFTSALDKLDTINGNLIINAVGRNGSSVIAAFVNKAATRGDSFVIVDPSKDDGTLAELQATAANYTGISNSSYAAHYTPALQMIDPAKTGAGAVRVTYPGGALAGLYVRTEVERTVAKAPAGFQAEIRGALGVTVKLSDADIGVLYDGTPYVNSFKVVPGAGITVNGARTFNRSNPDKFIPVRRTLNYLKVALKDISQFAVFEPNDDRLWNDLNVILSGFLTEFWRSGGLKGQRASEAFFVVCDSTNNTPATIDQGIVNVQVGVALTYPAEFIVINLSQWTGGSNAVESL
jgi:hypothetical protein